MSDSINAKAHEPDFKVLHEANKINIDYEYDDFSIPTINYKTDSDSSSCSSEDINTDSYDSSGNDESLFSSDKDMPLLQTRHVSWSTCSTEDSFLDANDWDAESLFLSYDVHPDDESKMDIDVFDIEDVKYEIPDPKARPATTPITILVAKTIGCCESKQIMKSLLDTGSMTTLMSRDKIPKSAQLIPIKSPHFVNTVAGKMQVKWVV